MASQQTLAKKLKTNTDQNSRDEFTVALYQELRILAESYLRQERVDHTLQPTALVHEAYLRLNEQDNIIWRNREHFMAMAATMMRRILVNHAIKRRCDKRGSGEMRMSLAEAGCFISDKDVSLVALDEALEKLAESYPQESRVVELKFFGGLTIPETARVMEISTATVERSWRFARTWLLRELSEE
jgi:RNA polymerase sigma-70 factor, ECF subfamily